MCSARWLLIDYSENTIRQGFAILLIAEINNYIDDNPSRGLILKANPNRIAWVTVGGTASGKSSLATLIDVERKKYGEISPVCYVNPDDYRELLLEKTEGPADSFCMADLLIARQYGSQRSSSTGCG